MSVTPFLSSRDRGWLARVGNLSTGGGGTPGGLWAATSVRHAWGMWPGGTTNHSDFANYETYIGGPKLRFRLMYSGSASDTSYSNSMTNFNTLTTITNTASMFHANNSPDICCVLSIPLCLNGQSLQTAATTTVNKSFWDGLAQRTFDTGFDSRRADGRPKIIMRPGWECNSTWYPWSYSNDIAKAGFYKQAFNQARAWFEAKLLSLGGDPTAIEWAYGINARRAGNPVGGVTGRGFVEAAFPNCEIFEVDAYDYSGFYCEQVPPGSGNFVSKSAADKLLAQDDVRWERSGKSVTGGYTDAGQGLDLVAELGVSRDVMVAVGEWSLWHNVNPATGEERPSNQSDGGNDNPDWVQHIWDWVAARVAEGRFGYDIHFDDDVASTGQQSRTRVGSEYDFPLSRQKILDLT